MSEEQKREAWGDYEPLDLELAKALAPLKGWKVLEGEGAAFFTNGSREWVSACLVVGDNMQFYEIPLFTESVDACLAQLPEDYAVSFWRERGIDCCQIYSTELGAWDGTGATRAEALASALLAYCLARNADAGDDDRAKNGGE